MDDATVLKQFIAKNQKPNDGLLHPSTHLYGWLGHVQRHMLRYELKDKSWGSDARLMTGTMWHELCDEAYRGIPAMNNVNLTPYLPVGWAGECDKLVFNTMTGKFRLKDFKTISNKSLEYLKEMRESHRWQASLYWHACIAASFPMETKLDIVYIPLDDNDIPADVTVLTADPIPWLEMSDRLNEIEHTLNSNVMVEHPGLEWNIWYDPRRKRHLIKRSPPIWSKWCPFVDCPCDKLVDQEHRVGWWIDGQLVLDRDCPVEYDVSEIPTPEDAF